MPTAATIFLLAPGAFAGINQDIDDIALSGLAFTSGNGAAGIAATRSTSRDVAERFFRLPGVEFPVPATAPVSEAGSKGGMAKGGMAKGALAATPPERPGWETYATMHYRSESQESQFVHVGTGDAATIPGFLQVHPEMDSESCGGTVGIERRIGQRWRLGFAVGGSSTEVEMTLAGHSELETLVLTPYVTFTQEDLWGFADLWAGLLYSHGSHDFELGRFTAGGLATASPEASTGQLEFVTGMNFRTSGVTHGPFAGVRWIDGTIDAYNEAGPTGLFPNQDLQSVATQLGYQISYPLRFSAGTLVPWLRVTWEHEFEDEPNRFLGIATGERDEDATVMGAGIGYGMANGWNLWLDYEGRISSRVEGHQVGLGAGVSF